MKDNGNNPEAIQSTGASQTAVCRATGPRTAHGKAISRRNALKFGIFSNELVIRNADWIPSETRKNFNRLLQWYVDHYQPEGPVEMHQLEIAVGALWRYRRLLRAEAGEIQNRKRDLDISYRYDSNPYLDVIIKQCGSVPGPHDIERLQRYEAHLLRIYYRALNEIERLQRMRLGDAVPAPVVVDIQN